MYQLLYLSTAKDLMSDDELESLSTQSKINNHQNKVTGMLVYYEGSFIQILEGDEEQVKSLFQKISHDPRHKSIYLIDHREIENRSFQTWDMAFKKLTKDDLENYPSLKSLIKNSDKDESVKLTDIEEAFISISVY